MASEVEIPEPIVTQAHQDATESMKEDNQEKNHLAVVEGSNKNTNGECFLYPPSVGKVALEGINKLSEDQIEPELSKLEVMPISDNNNSGEMDDKNAASEEEEKIAEKTSLQTEAEETQKEEEVESALQVGEPEADIEQVEEESAKMNSTVTNHDNLLDVPAETLEVLKEDKKSECGSGDQERCTKTAVSLDSMTLLGNNEAPVTGGEESLVQCNADVEGMAQSEEKMKDGDEETLSIGASAVTQTAMSLVESDEELKEAMGAGIQLPESTIVEEKICLQQVEKDIRSEEGSNNLFEEIGQEKKGTDETLKEELKLEDKNVENDKVNQEADMDLDKGNNEVRQILSSKTDDEVPTGENLKENFFKLVSEDLQPVEQHLPLGPACVEKQRSSEITAEECIEIKATKQEEAETICQEENLKMVSGDIALEATEETTTPEEGKSNLSIADSEDQEKGNDTLEVEDFSTSGVPQDKTLETDAEEINSHETTNISKNEDNSPLLCDEVAQPLENEDEDQYETSKFKPKEQEKQEIEVSSEEEIHDLNASEAGITTESAVSEGNSVEEALTTGLYSATSMLEGGETEDFHRPVAEKGQEDNDKSRNLPMEKEQNQSTFSEEDHTHEVTNQEMAENLQDEKTEDTDLQHSLHQETAENNRFTGAMLETSVPEITESTKDTVEDQKSTEETSEPEKPLEGDPLKTRNVNQILGEVLDSPIEKFEESLEADNQMLSTEYSPEEEKPKEITSAQAPEEIDDICTTIEPAENNLTKQEIIDDKLEQEPCTTDSETHFLNMRNQAACEDDNSRESSEQMTVNMAERAVDLTCQQDDGEVYNIDKAPPNYDEITNENNNDTPNVTKEENADSLSTEKRIIEEVTEESIHSHHTIEESPENVETEIYQDKDLEDFQKQTSEEDSALDNQVTEPEKEESICVPDIAVAEKEGDDLACTTSLTEAEEEERTFEKNVYHVESSIQSDFTNESGMQKTIDKAEVLQEAKSEKGDHLEEKENTSISVEEDIMSTEVDHQITVLTTSTTQALETSLETSPAVDIRDECSSDIPSEQKEPLTCSNDEDDVNISRDIERVYDVDEIIDKEMVTTAECTTEESVDKHTEDEKFNMRQETAEKPDDVLGGTPTDDITEEFGQVSSLLPTTEHHILTPEGKTEMHINDPESSNIEGHVCPCDITDKPETVEDNGLINITSVEGNSDLGHQIQETSINVEATGPGADAEDAFERQDDFTNISNDGLQICERKEELTEGDDHDQENEGLITDVVSTEKNAEPNGALENCESCSESADASKNSTSSANPNKLETEESQAAEDQDMKSAMNNHLEEHDKNQDVSNTESEIQVEAEGSTTIAEEGDDAAKELEHEEEIQSIKKEAIEEDVHNVMAEKADDEDTFEIVNEDSSQQHDESNTMEADKIKLTTEGKEHEQIRFSNIHVTNPVEDKEILNHISEENSGNEKETAEASSHQDECNDNFNDRIQVLEVQEEETTNRHFENIDDEGPNSIIDDASARENSESIVTTDEIEHRTDSDDNRITSIEATELATEENSRIMQNQDAEHSEQLCQEGHRDDQGLSVTELETESKDKELVSTAGDANQAENALELDEETQSFTKEVTEDNFQQVIMEEIADEQEHSENSTEELDIKTQKGGQAHEQSGSGTDVAKGEETMNQILEDSSSGDNIQNQESLQESTTDIVAENPIPINDEHSKISTEETQIIEDQEEATIGKQHDSPDSRVENTISHGVSAEEIIDPTEAVEELECGSENLIEARRADNEATGRDVNDPDANSADTLIMDEHGDAKTSSAKAAEINLVERSIEKAEDATQTINELEANEESNVNETHTEEVKSTEANVDSPQLENERNTCMSDNMQVHEDENVNEQNKSSKMEGSYLIKDEQTVHQSSEADSTTIEKPNQPTTTCVEASEKNVDDEMGTRNQDEYHETTCDKTEVVEANEVAGTNVEGHSHENEVPETINSIFAEENPKQVDAVQDREWGTETTGACEYSTRGGDTDIQVYMHTSTSANQASEDEYEEPGSSTMAKISEEYEQLEEGSQLSEVQKLDISKQDNEEEQEVNCDETENKETVNAEGNDDISEEPSEPQTYESESLSSADVLDQTFDIPNKVLEEDEKQGADNGETTHKNETDIEHDFSEEQGSSLDAETSKESQCNDVPTPELHVSKEVEVKEEGPIVNCGEEEKKTKTLSEGNDYLSQTNEESTPLEASHSPEGVIAPEFDVTDNCSEEEKQAIHCGEKTNKTDIVTAETKNDSPEKIGASHAPTTPEECPVLEITQSSKDVVPEQGFTEEERDVSNETAETAGADIKDASPYETTKMSTECASLDEIEPAEDVLDSKFSHPTEVIEEEEKQGGNCGEMCEMETVNMEVKENLSEKTDVSATEKISERGVLIEESQSPKDTLKEDVEEEKQGEIIGEIANKSANMNASVSAKTGEYTPLEESQASEDVLASEFEIPIESIKEEKQPVESGETATEIGNVEIKDDLPEDSCGLVPEKVSEQCVPLEECQLYKDVSTSEFDIPKEDINEGKMLNAEINDDLPDDLGASVAEKMSEGDIADEEGVVLSESESKTETENVQIKDDIPEDMGSSTTANMSEQCSPLFEGQSSEDVSASELDNAKEANEKKQGENCGETASEISSKIETLSTEVEENLPELDALVIAKISEEREPTEEISSPENTLKEDVEKEKQGEIDGEIACTPDIMKSEFKDDLPEEPSVSVSAKTEECTPLEETQSSTDALDSQYEAPIESIKEEKREVVSGHAASETETVNEEFKDAIPEELGSLFAAKISEEGVTSRETQSSEDVVASVLDIPKEGNKEEKGVDSEETACGVQNVHTQVNDDLLKESSASDDSDAAKMSDKCAPLEEIEPSKDVLDTELDVPKEDKKEEEKQGEVCCETADKTDIVYEGIKGDYSEPGTPVAAPLETSCFSEDALAPNTYVPERDTDDGKQGVESGVTEYKTETLDAQVKDDLVEEPGASIEAKTSEEYATCEESLSSEDVLLPKHNIKKEGIEEETNSQEGHLEGNAINALDVSTTEDNEQKNGRKELPTNIEEIVDLTAEKFGTSICPELLQQSEDFSSPEIDANQSVENVELEDCQDICTMTADENVQDQSSGEQLGHSSSIQLADGHKATSAEKDTEEETVNIEAIKEERPDDSYSQKRIPDEIQRQLDESNSDFEPSKHIQISQERVENAGITEKLSMGEVGEQSSESEGVNPPSDSETKNSESYTDSLIQDITNETELQISNKSEHTNNVSLQTDATSENQEQIVSSEQMSTLYGQELKNTEDIDGEKQCKEEISELIAKENQSKKDFEEHEATTCDTNREKDIEPDDLLEGFNSSSEVLVSSEKNTELDNANREENAETSAEDKGDMAESAESCIEDGSSLKNAKDTDKAANELRSDDEFTGREATEDDFQQVTREITDYKVDRTNMIDSVNPKVDAPELPSQINASVQDKVEVQKGEKEHEVMGSNEIDGLNSEKDEVINQRSDDGDSSIGKPNQQAVEASELHLDGERNIQDQDNSVDISNDTIEVVHIQDTEATETEHHLNKVSEEEGKCVDIAYEAETTDGKEKDTSQEELNWSNVVKTPQGWGPPQENEKSEDVTSQEVDVSLENLEEKQQLIECSDDLPKIENLILVKKEMGLQEPQLQENIKKALDINPTVENEEEITVSGIIAREVDVSSAVNDGKQYPPEVEEDENLAARDTDTDHFSENQVVNVTDEVKLLEVVSPLKSHDIEELTAADIIASQISLAIERDEQLQQQSSEQLQENEATTIVMGDNTRDNQVLRENTNSNSSDETIRMACLPKDGQTELEVPNLKCELEQADPEEHQKTISSELIAEQKSTITSEAPEVSISDAANEKDASQASSDEETKAQSQYEDRQTSESNPEEDEKQPVLAREIEIPDEKVLYQDPKVAQQDSQTTKTPDNSEKVVIADESIKVNSSLVAGQTDEAVMESYIVPHIPKVQEQTLDDKRVRIEDENDKNLLETQQMEDVRNHENANKQSTLVVKEEKDEHPEHYGSAPSKGAFEEQIGSCPSDGITTTLPHGDKAVSLVPEHPVKENLLVGAENPSLWKDKNGDNGCQEQKGEDTNDTKTLSTPRDSTRIPSSDTMQGFRAQTCQTEQEEEIIPKEKPIDREYAATEEPHTDEEKEEEGNNEIQTDSDLNAPFITEAMRDMDIKATPKKSHNILSGVGSKVKHSISKVKKAITCSSSQFASEDVIVKFNKNKKS